MGTLGNLLPFKIMNIRDLEYFLAVAELKHFRKASEKCFVSQPALSGQIKKLEEELGLALFMRDKRDVQLTAAGETLVNYARKIISETENFTEAAKSFRDPRSGTFKMGIIPSLAPYLIPNLIQKTNKWFPKLDLYISESKTKDLLNSIAVGDLEAGILALPLQEKNFQVAELFTEPFLLAIPASHRLARRQKATLADLENECVFLLEEGHCLKDQVLEVCQLAGAREHSFYRASSLETLRQMVAAGQGITLMPWLAVHEPISQASSIRYIPFVDPAPNRRIALVWRKGSPRESFLQEWSKELFNLYHLKI